MSPIEEATRFIRDQYETAPKLAIILGSGLGGVADQIQDATRIRFGDIPGFANPTAGGHRGQLILGHLDQCPVVAMAGRFHRYEGHSRATVTFPVCVMHALGADTLIVSNAAGGLDPRYSVGDLVVIADHIDWLSGGPLCSPDPASPFLGRSSALYSPYLMDLAVQAGLRHQFVVHRGTYLGTLGPTYETRAEYRMMRRIGADLAGMSTVPETIQGGILGMNVLAVSMVSNLANPDAPQVASHQEVLEAGIAAAAKMEKVVWEVVGAVNATDEG